VALYYKGTLRIPAKDDLRKMIYEVEYDSMDAGYMGQEKMIEIIKHNLFWLGMDKYLKILSVAVSFANVAKRQGRCAGAYFLHWS
jgi:hypothetical protein